MSAGHIEPLSAVVRVGGAYGQPFTWAAALRYLDPQTVEIVAATRAPTPSEWRELRQVLTSSGITRAVFTRVKNGEKTQHEVV